VLLFGDTALAYINATGNGTAGNVTITAVNNQSLINVVGGVAVGLTVGDNTPTSSQWAGAFSAISQTNDTEAFIQGITLIPTGDVKLTASHGGSLLSFSAALAFDISQTGNAFSGSVSLNLMFDTTKAFISNATVGTVANKAKSVSLSATDDPTLLAIGGAASFTTGLRGVAGSFGYNMITSTTEAGIFGASDTSRASVAATNDVIVSALNNDSITAIGVSAGITTGAQANAAAAFTIGMNVLSTSSNVFNRANANGLIAKIQYATITAGGAVSVTATDNSGILAIGGALAINARGSFALGAGLGWNQIALLIDAEISSSTVTAGGGVTVAALSSQAGNPLNSKIVSASVGAAVSAGGQGPGTAIGANISVNGTFNTITAEVDTNSIVNAGAAVAIGATDNSTIQALSGAVAIAAGSSGTAAGAALGANYISNVVTASIDTSTSSPNITTNASGAALAGAVAIGVSQTTVTLTNTNTASIGSNANISAKGNFSQQATTTDTITANSSGSTSAIITAVSTSSASVSLGEDVGRGQAQGAGIDRDQTSERRGCAQRQGPGPRQRQAVRAGDGG
jgi:hypothetical protein